MKLICGLGNPGAKYSDTRHNVGFMFIDYITEAQNPVWLKKFEALCYKADNGMHYVKPQTYMNQSGVAVGKIANFFNLKPENILVLHDELELAFGVYKIKFGGGSAGHNGIKSITASLGTEDYWRIKIGIGRPANKDEVSNYVLSNFSLRELTELPLIFASIRAQYNAIS